MKLKSVAQRPVTEAHRSQRGKRARRGFGSDEWDSEHREIRELVVGDGGVREDLKCFLSVDADVGEDEEKQDHRAGEGDGVDRSAIAGVEAGQPGWGAGGSARGRRGAGG